MKPVWLCIIAVIAAFLIAGTAKATPPGPTICISTVTVGQPTYTSCNFPKCISSIDINGVVRDAGCIYPARVAEVSFG